MNWQAISAVAETVAALGVILSLLYVGVQVRQSTRQMRLDTLHAVVSELGRVHDSLALHGDLGDIALRGFQDYESLSPVERVRFSGYLAHMFKLFEQLAVLGWGVGIGRLKRHPWNTEIRRTQGWQMRSERRTGRHD